MPPRGAHQAVGGDVVIHRTPTGWVVENADCSGIDTGDLYSAMVLADLLSEELEPGPRPPRLPEPLDEVERLRLAVKQLEHALAARVIIEQAIGVLAERQRLKPRDAFERLRRVARSRGRRVHPLAREVVACCRCCRSSPASTPWWWPR